MARIEWNESYTCNIELIDEQHREILGFINQLDDAITQRDRDTVGLILNDMVSAIINHFEFEEELMAQSGYGHLNAHKKLHDRFIEKLTQYTQRYDSGECIVEEIQPFLVTWFPHHTDEDKDYSAGVADELNDGARKKKGWFSRTFGSKS